jgi:Protein of unknown function (DUF1176)
MQGCGALVSSLAVAGLIFVASPGVARGQAPSVPVERSFTDWVVGCDNTRSCVALGLAPEDSTQSAFIQVVRQAGPGAPPEVRLALYDDLSAQGTPMSITVDGAAVPGFAVRTPPRSEDDGYSVVELAPSEGRRFLDVLRRARRLNLAVAGGEGGEVSLDGATAALLFIDDVQGRVGTVTALARPGRRPESAVPGAAAPPVVRAVHAPDGADADQNIAGLVREHVRACDAPEPGWSDFDDVLPLGQDRVLVSLLCTRAAYNQDFVYFIVDGGSPGDARAVRFPVPPGSEDDQARETEVLTNARFDPQSGQLGFFAKGRGIADCGSSGLYGWTGDGFALLSYRAMRVCRGVPEGFWPVLWTASTQ